MLGIAVHICLQELTRIVELQGWEAALLTLPSLASRLAAQARGAGIDNSHSVKLADRAIDLATAASQHPAGRWMLSPHPAAASEVRWAGVVAKGVHLVQADRVFRAGPEPLQPGEQTWWIIDYKTAHPDGIDPQAALPQTTGDPSVKL